ncbi:MAG: hypothetical protein ACRDJN_23475, partial [Chloroflexota bacterium]
MTMIRKQLYIEDKQQRKLRTLAARWGCTEAEVVRKAIDRLADPDDLDSLVIRRLSEAGLLVPPPDDPDLPSAEEADAWEERETAWLDSQPPLG